MVYPNNLGRQFTSPPDFGDIYPNTQYKGYAEAEGAPFGQASNLPNSGDLVNQYNYYNQSFNIGLQRRISEVYNSLNNYRI